MSTLSLGTLTDELRQLSGGAVTAAQHLGQGAADAAHQVGQSAAGAAHQLGRVRPVARRRRRLPSLPPGRLALWALMAVVVVVAARWAARTGASRPGDVPTPVDAPRLDDAAVAADLGGAMA